MAAAAGNIVIQSEPSDMEVGSEQLVLEGGFSDDIFIDEDSLDGYKCSFCEKVMRQPCQRICGHLFCNVCLEKLKRRSMSSVEHVYCPRCVALDDVAEESRITQNEISSPDFATTRSLEKRRVKCPYRGCQYFGMLKDYEKEHELSCSFALIACPNGCDEEIHVSRLRSHLDRHCPMRTLICPYCKSEYLAKDEQVHIDLCPVRPIKCELCGMKDLTKEQYVEHRDNECPYFWCSLGCNAKMPREATADHYKDLHYAKQHMVHIGRAFAELDVGLKSVQSISESVPEIVPAEDNRVDEILDKLPDIEDQVKTLDNICTVFKIGFEKLSESLILNSQRQEQIAQVEADMKDRLDRMEQAVQIRDVQLMERDLRLKSLEYTSYDGVLIWRVDNFNECCQKAVSGEVTSMYSPAFYTSRCGYKMCARLYLNGDGIGKSSHISFFFVIMRGRYDGLLRWPFKQKVTMMLLDHNGQHHVMDAFRPDGDSASFHRPKNDMNVASGCPLFLPLTKLREKIKDYVKDDVAYFKIIVDTADIEY